MQCPGSPQYSEVYWDTVFEYRHVLLTKDMAMDMLVNCVDMGRLKNMKLHEKVEDLPRRLMSEAEWRDLGVCISKGWVHNEYHA